jgi:DNA-binding NarL/FixJ family response regulator
VTNSKKRVALCETQPITIEGLRSLLADSDLAFTGAALDLRTTTGLIAMARPDVLLLDKSFGVQALLEWLVGHRVQEPPVSYVVWGAAITEPEALRFLKAGAKGILHKTASPDSILSCLSAVASGQSWMEDSLFGRPARGEHSQRAELTPREQQVLYLVEQGLKNTEIGRELGIRPGTVKIHLKHIFEKTGVRGRYGLALTGMKERCDHAAPTAEALRTQTGFAPGLIS